MFLSIVICTIRRPELIQELLGSLAGQTYRDFETLLVGAEEAPEESPSFEGLPQRPRFLPAPRGLAPARNVGLREAKGDLICFLDDDVTLPATFFADAVALMQRPDFHDVGGLTGYDTRNYPQGISLRWKLRYRLGIIPSLRPGAADHLGRNVPINFLQPFSGIEEMGWLPGFCQIYRRAAVEGIFCDEEVIGGDDRDLSMQVGERWRLALAGDLHLEHHQDSQGRFPSVRQLWRVAYGMGRSLSKGRRSRTDSFIIGRYLAAELFIDLLALVRRPSLFNVRIVVTRQRGYIAGLRSLKRTSAELIEFRGLAGRGGVLTDE